MASEVGVPKVDGETIVEETFWDPGGFQANKTATSRVGHSGLSIGILQEDATTNEH
jgi:hypothetical protein